jgi:hypothetical protein
MAKAVTRICFLAMLSAASFAGTPIEVQPIKELRPTGSLGTCTYVPSTTEKPFFDKLAVSEQATGSFLEKYDIHKKNGQFVSWFGIVRGISRVPHSDAWDLLLEHKYFDGMSDCHIMLVSMSGSGDFSARVEGADVPVPALALVRIYGKVSHQKSGPPRIDAEFIRVWPWMTFTFTDLGGDDRTNPKWKKVCKLCKGQRVYRPYPDEQYYRQALGDPGEYGIFLK